MKTVMSENWTISSSSGRAPMMTAMSGNWNFRLPIGLTMIIPDWGEFINEFNPNWEHVNIL